LSKSGSKRETGFKTENIDATQWIAEISPRPVFQMKGGASADSGQRLYDAAGEPKELWFDPASVMSTLMQSGRMSSRRGCQSFLICICWGSNNM